jgi:hypothetical protein
LYEILTGKEFFKHVKTRSQLLSELKEFSSNLNKVKYPKSLHPEWSVLTNKMLCHNAVKRPSFADVKIYFKEVEATIKADLEKKYGD